MVCVSLGRTGVICTIHNRKLIDLESASSNRHRYDCCLCGKIIMFAGCWDCRGELVRRCAECGADFCTECGAMFGIGDRYSGQSLCRRCHPYLFDRDE